MINFETVSEEEVDVQNILFCDDDKRCNRSWGKVSFQKDYFYIGWRSKIVPEIKLVGTSAAIIGIDENYAVFSKKNPTAILGKSQSPLLGMYVLNDIAALRFEMEVHIYKAGMSKILCEFSLPDLSESLVLKPTSITVKCMDDPGSYNFDFPVLEQ